MNKCSHNEISNLFKTLTVYIGVVIVILSTDNPPKRISKSEAIHSGCWHPYILELIDTSISYDSG